jgi:hypothetical protein
MKRIAASVTDACGTIIKRSEFVGQSIRVLGGILVPLPRSPDGSRDSNSRNKLKYVPSFPSFNEGCRDGPTPVLKLSSRPVAAHGLSCDHHQQTGPHGK